MASSWLLLLGSTGENDKNYYSAATITNEPSQQINPASSAYRMKYLNTDAKSFFPIRLNWLRLLRWRYSADIPSYRSLLPSHSLR